MIGSVEEKDAGFDAIRISLASPEQIERWSYGEVTKAETINYRTLRPEKDGLFCEKIFGPTKDWECYCGKYKKIRFKGVICDRCGVEIARAKVRRERMGHIALAAPVIHLWFSKSTPSRLGLLLDISPRNLDRVIYFAQYLITSIDEDAKNTRLSELESERELTIANLDKIFEERQLNEQIKSESDDSSNKEETEKSEDELLESHELRKSQLTDEYDNQIKSLSELRLGELVTETKLRELKSSFGTIFNASMGAEAILQILENVDLEALKNQLQEEMRTTSGQRRRKSIKRLRVVEAFRKSGNKPEWMVLKTLPVLPPELRPMVQLDGGRFATSDLNDLYRRVINRNNRLKRLIDLQAPEIIIRNEKRMLQEAVDALIDNGKRGRSISGTHNHKLKSLSDLLRGKQGRFRQNLLGKRVDYSGRSVIAVGPSLKLDECGIPRKMALELFKPFVMNSLVMNGYAHNIKSAKRLAEKGTPEVWDILEGIIEQRPVLLNRAPTLHRLGIQAFKPILVDGGAIRVHPLVCTAFNADFDGDQMAVHVPLSDGAVMEANKVMMSSQNMLSPSSGQPIVTPTLDIVLGCYYLTLKDPYYNGSEIKSFATFDDAMLAHNLDVINIQTPIKIHNPDIGSKENTPIETTVGRIIFNNALPDDLDFVNENVDKGLLGEITSDCYNKLGNDVTSEMLDEIKDLGFKYASKSGTTIGIDDVSVAPAKNEIINEADGLITILDKQHYDGLITDNEKYTHTVNVWSDADKKIESNIEDNFTDYGSIYLMAVSGAKGNLSQIKQMAGMRGLMSDPKGRIIERPIKSNFREGLSVLEYFISTHGARKGLADTALRTADSGYLTRRLIDVAQELTVITDDCDTSNYLFVSKEQEDELLPSFSERIKARTLASPVADAKTGELILDASTEIGDKEIEILENTKIDGVYVRSPLTCACERGLCKKCYGRSLTNLGPTILGEAVGIIAAQSIGEPGTQLTMRTFHTGGVASAADITSGLPRVEELFEARSPKGEAILTEIDGTVELIDNDGEQTVIIKSSEEYSDSYPIPDNYTLLTKNNKNITANTAIAKPKGRQPKDPALQKPLIISRVNGKVSIDDQGVTISWEEETSKAYFIPATSNLLVKEGESVIAGQALTSGPKNPQQILAIQGREAVENYLIEEVQKVYRSQGVAIHNKHIEVIVSQMLRKVRIDSTGDTDLLPGELLEKMNYEQVNSAILAEGGEPATASPVLLGITRASLNMESFLASASFQETTRVLTEASVNAQVDHLRGLKENVIIGRLIPARIDGSEEGRRRLGLPEPNALEASPIALLEDPENIQDSED